MTKFDIDKKLLDKLAKTFKEADLTDLDYFHGDQGIRMRRKAAKVVTTSFAPPFAAPGGAVAPAAFGAPEPSGVPVAGALAAASGAAPAPGAKAVTSPMVGTVYLSAEPGKAAFVSVGDTVSEGQTLLIIEAMKVMNPLESPRAGTVTDILVADSEPVEFGQPLVVIE